MPLNKETKPNRTYQLEENCHSKGSLMKLNIRQTLYRYPDFGRKRKKKHGG